jgi:hypothetical protein
MQISNWGQDPPIEGNEDVCVAFNTTDGKWYPKQCNEKYPFLCKHSDSMLTFIYTTTCFQIQILILNHQTSHQQLAPTASVQIPDGQTLILAWAPVTTLNTAAMSMARVGMRPNVIVLPWVMAPSLPASTRRRR